MTHAKHNQPKATLSTLVRLIRKLDSSYGKSSARGEAWEQSPEGQREIRRASKLEGKINWVKGQIESDPSHPDFSAVAGKSIWEILYS